MARRKKFIPAWFDFSQLSPLVENSTEVDKTTLISRAAGRVDYPFLTLLKMLQFFKVGKDHSGNLYLS